MNGYTKAVFMSSELIVLHFLLSVACYMGHEWEEWKDDGLLYQLLLLLFRHKNTFQIRPVFKPFICKEGVFFLQLR